MAPQPFTHPMTTTDSVTKDFGVMDSTVVGRTGVSTVIRSTCLLSAGARPRHAPIGRLCRSRARTTQVTGVKGMRTTATE